MDIIYTKLWENLDRVSIFIKKSNGFIIFFYSGITFIYDLVA